MQVVTAADPVAGPVLLFDGTCGLCARSVQWILRHERDDAIRFAPLQGPTAAELRRKYPQIPQALEAVVYIDGGRAHLRSKAFFHLSDHLRAPWRWLHAVRWFPGFIPNLGYRVIAAVRYRVWGRADRCDLPDPEQRSRFLP